MLIAWILRFFILVYLLTLTDSVQLLFSILGPNHTGMLYMYVYTYIFKYIYIYIFYIYITVLKVFIYMSGSVNIK